MSVYRPWNHIDFTANWKGLDTSILDDIADSWFLRREILQAKSNDYKIFLDRLKRKHAIETGIIENIYDLDKGVTETLINEGFIASFVSHGDANISSHALFNHLNDHLDAFDFVFDVVRNNRPLTNGFICELHQLITRHQDYAEGRDQFGNKTKIQLLKGKFKERENNPTRPDGTRILYCPPEHVNAEMDRLIDIYNDLNNQKVNPLIIASWVHHAFTTIHPFQDGNGRVVRLIASLILIKNKFFPITVSRDEAKLKYIQSLEEADHGNPQNLINYFAELQKNNILQALNISEVSQTSLEQASKIFKEKIINSRGVKYKQLTLILEENRSKIFNFCANFLREHVDKLNDEFQENASFYIEKNNAFDIHKQKYELSPVQQDPDNSSLHFINILPLSAFTISIAFNDRNYEIEISFHQFGYDDSVLAIGAFLKNKTSILTNKNDLLIPTMFLDRHVFSLFNDMVSKEKNICLFLENALKNSIERISNEI